MLDVVMILYVIQLFLMAMAGMNIINGIRHIIVDKDYASAKTCLSYGFSYGFTSMGAGIVAWSLLQ